MADVQLEHGFTKLANEILEKMALIKLSPIQYRIIFVIWRYTYGFNRKEHTFSLSFLSNGTNYDQRQLQRELIKLEERKIIFQRVQKGKPRVIWFNKNYDEWLDETIGNSTKGGIGNSTKGGIGNSTKGTIGKVTKGTIGNSTKEEIKNLNKNIKKDDDMKPNPFLEYEKSFGVIPVSLIDEFNYWIDESQFTEPEDIICEVIKRAQKQMPRNPAKYVVSIIKDLHRMELYSLAAVKEHNEKFDKKVKNGTGYHKKQNNIDWGALEKEFDEDE